MSEADRFICTAAEPWYPGLGKYALHPDAELVDVESGQYGDEYEKYHCPHCHITFWTEVSQ